MVNCHCYMFLIFGTMMCAASHGKTVNGMFWMLTIFRGVTGFGIGAEYPSSSVTASEAANESVKKTWWCIYISN